MKYKEIAYSENDREWHDALKEVPKCQGETDYSNYVSVPCVVYTKDNRVVLACWDSMNKQWFSLNNHNVEKIDAMLWTFMIEVIWESVDAIIEKYNREFEMNMTKIACNL